MSGSSSRHKVEVSPSEWTHINSKAFPLWSTTTFLNLDKKDMESEKFNLFPHQRFVRDYLQYKSPYRGLLLYHGLGAGKTCAAIAVAEILNNNKDVYVMLLASLENNFRTEIMRCGHEKYTIHQFWEFVSVDDESKKPSSVKVSTKLIKKHKGYWIASTDKQANFKNLSPIQQQQVNMQMNELINKKYNFISFNGIDSKKYDTMSKSDNPFHDKLVIIDEAHLFISRVANQRKVSVEIYKDLINARNAKIVLLTGTPIINHPFEIAFTLNLINGLNVVYNVKYNKNFANTSLLDAHDDVLSYQLNQHGSKRSISITLTPHGFKKNAVGKLVFVNETKTKTKCKGAAKGKENCVLSDEERIQLIVDDMVKSGVEISKGTSDVVTSQRLRLFPTNKEEFSEHFMDLEKATVKNENVFLNRMIGLVSFYENNDTALYPENLGTIEESIPFSDYQFNKYAQKRQEEISKEKANKFKKKQGLFDQQMGVYMTFSRMLCNFAFPDKIDRPYPSNNRFSVLENELDMDDAFESSVEKIDAKSAGAGADKNEDYKKVYAKQVKKALKGLESKGTEYLVRDLHEYSPKFKRILENLQLTNGTSLIYSQFRTVEGLGVLGLALKARGYVEMKLALDTKTKTYRLDVDEADYMKPKFASFSTNKEESKILMKIFNSDVEDLNDDIKKQLKQMDTEKTSNQNLRGSWIKILMITESGSAGISLKNVRQVHIMEPYWNASRIQQVVGRANRTNSHKDLPKNERNFQVFTYRMRISKEQLKTSTYIKLNDQGLSTDEKIHAIAQKKDAITSTFLDLIKRGSVDCAINTKDVKCHAFPLETNVFEKAYLEILADDFKAHQNSRTTRELKVKVKKVTIEKKSYIWIPDTDELFDFDVYAKTRMLDARGTLTDLKNDWFRLKLK